MNIYLGYLLYVVQILLLGYVSFLFYKHKKWYFVLIGIILFFVSYGYLMDYFYSFFVGGGANFTGIIYGIGLLIIIFIYFILSFLKDKNYFIFYTGLVLFMFLLGSLGLFSNKILNKKISNFNDFISTVINNSGNITDNQKYELLMFEEKYKNTKFYWKVDSLNLIEAKRIAGYYEFDYCKQTESKECFLEFLKGEKGIDGYADFSGKYNDYIKKYGKYITKEDILEGLKSDLLIEINSNIKKQSVKVLGEIGIKHDSSIEISNIVGKGVIYDKQLYIDGMTYNYFTKELYANDKNLAYQNRRDITEKRELIKRKIENLKKYFFKDLTYTEKYEAKGSYSDGKNNFKLYRSNIDIQLNSEFNLNLKFDDGNALYIRYYADLNKYLIDSDYRKQYFENLRLLYYYFDEGKIHPYISNVLIKNLGPDMDYNYDLNTKYRGNVINKQTLDEVLIEKNSRFLESKYIASKSGKIKNTYNFTDLLRDKNLLTYFNMNFNIISDNDFDYFKKTIKNHFEAKGYKLTNDYKLTNISSNGKSIFLINKKYIIKFPKGISKNNLWFTYLQEGVGDL